MEKLNEILCEVLRLSINELKDELTMEDIKSWDSLTHMNLVTSIEEELEIFFSMDDIMIMRDIKTIKKLVQDKLV